MIGARALNQSNKSRLPECEVEAILRIELCSDYVRPLQLLEKGSRETLKLRYYDGHAKPRPFDAVS